MNKFQLLPLTLAVSAAFTTTAFAAVSQPKVVLAGDTVVSDRQGAKIKTNVVTLREKDESTATDLRSLLQDEPAIGFGGGNGTSQFVSIRGMGHNAIDLKIDNAYQDGQLHYHQGRFMLDPQMVKVVSVQKGAGFASAGIGATNGAIVTKTLDANDLLANSSNPNFGAKVKADYSSNKGHGYGASAFGKTDNFDFVVSANVVNDSNYKDGSGREIEYSALDKKSYLAKAGVNLGDHRLSLSHLQESHKGVRPVREEFVNFDLKRQAPHQRDTYQKLTNLEWTGKNLGFANEAVANVYRLEHGRDSQSDLGNGYATGGSPEAKDDKLADTPSNMHVVATGANLNFDTEFNHSPLKGFGVDHTLLKYGINYRHQEAVPPRSLNAGVVHQEKTDAGIYLEAVNQINDFTINTGVRVDRFDFKAMDGKKVGKTDINPSFGVIYDVNPNLSVSGNLIYATRSPRFADAILSRGYRGGVISIDDNAKAEKARNTEIGFNYNNGPYTAFGSYFWQRVDNARATADRVRHGTTDANGKPIKVPTLGNQGHQTNHGYELGVGYTEGAWRARAGVAHSKPTMHNVKFGGNPEYAVRTGRTWTADVAYRLPNPSVELGVRHTLVEGVDAKDTSIISGQLDKSRDGKTIYNREGYNVSDIYANWKPYGNDKVNVNFSVNNVFNKNYRPHTQRASDITLPGAGRDFRVGVNFTY
ncbi:TonB-dependent receptor domain-containing protein [Moraxella catarrhalis]|uniref:Outer membrane receptor protein, mostly Fe transport n=1 Tax=Moraxella catarrhalis TaxID=480 RepID=A0A198UJC3_MORCA|nr:TonB-dependent receptor [Moraxella catarrhalis]OAU96379.1 Outer membrane receptor protein, mostly Fe transport [Moraxella catarrhalis]OAU97172.1 Outer membrane receptor protein, mostly Fe transport [Moraxella catarrhalis]OAU99716.1 Outer membrane receptor protein, mostly Fe transport [Moraxella catarrhalis]